MAKINNFFLDLKEQYVFSEISRKIKEKLKKDPNLKFVNLGIGDVTKPINSESINAMIQAVERMKKEETFVGYGPYEGYEFLRQAIRIEYKKISNVDLELDELFVGNGSKDDIGNICDIFAYDLRALIINPVYPAYLDVNIMRGSKINFLVANEENNFLPMPESSQKVDIIYLCSPNNPTGACYDKSQLQIWVDYANDLNAVIFFDGAYESFIEEKELPRSIYEIPNAKKCAIEFRSFSKTAGFTGLRCSYLVIPKELKVSSKSLNELYTRMISSKTNGVSYVTQKGAEATFEKKAQKEIRESIMYYKENAKIIANTLKRNGIKPFGYKNSPYIWFKCHNKNSWEFFDFMLEKFQTIGTPGIGFGSAGDNFFRFSAFENRKNIDVFVKKVLTIGF